jgi:tetratricopeptide (TPR) repeat protein
VPEKTVYFCSSIKSFQVIRKSRYFLLLFFSCLLISCSTQKNTWVTRNYHALTAKYNIFFNGNEAFKKGLKKVETLHKEDYSQLLPIFKFGNDNTAKTIAGDMDRTVKKASKVISMHSIKVKPAIKKTEITEKEKAFYEKGEYNPWVGEAYILMGKAQFYKHDFKLCLEAFKYVMKYFPLEPIHYQALVWMARANVQLNEMTEAQKILDLLGNDANLPKGYKADYYLSYADFLIKKKDLKGAANNIERGYEFVKKEDDKIRYNYILAQLYSKLGDNAKASDYYNKVIKMNPPYEMAFNAMISQASATFQGQNVDQIRKQLNKLLKDKKNKEYQDQIYFALANLSIQEKNIEEAIVLYKKSARVSVSNPRQKGRSYKTIADIYYEKPDYLQAEAFYDSTMIVADQTFPDIDMVKARAKNLTELVINLRAVEFQDSVQILAKLSEKDLLALIDKKIEKLKQDELEAKQKEQEKLQSQQFDQNFEQTNYMAQVGQSSGSWYFYNETVKTLGETDFKRKWGNRKLEDNWRRLNKKATGMENMEAAGGEETATGTESKKIITNTKTREYYLQFIPLNDSMMEESHKKIMNALYNAGTVYKDNLKEPMLALKEFRELNSRYPENEHLLSSYYNMYLIYKEKADAANVEVYKNLIVNKFPDSKYAKLLSNPHYLEELDREEKRVYIFYDTLFSAYNNKEFQFVITKVEPALKEFKSTDMIPKFLYIRALAYGSLGDTLQFRNELKNLVKQFPKREESESAKNMIFSLDNRHPTMKLAEEQKQAEDIFKYQPDLPHVVVIVLPKGGNKDQLVFNLINYNLDNFTKINLAVSAELLGKDYSLVKIKPFSNAAQAQNYLNTINSFNDMFKDVNPGNHKEFIISEVNLPKMLIMNSPDNYLLYYTKFYLNKK